MVSILKAREDAFTFSSLFILSAATLLYEINLTRLFSVTQYYHFAFLIIGFAMFGFGASGTCFALFPQLAKHSPRVWMAGFAAGMTLTICVGYILMNILPFDSFSIAWDWHQGVILALHSLTLSLPFFCSGAVLNICFAQKSTRIGQVYAVNLIGSACGCILAMILPGWIGGEGVSWLSALLGALSALIFIQKSELGPKSRIFANLVITLLISVIIIILIAKPSSLELRLSPYKGLSYVNQYPDSEVVSTRWNGYSRVDVVSSTAIKSLPGLSYLYQGPLPDQRAVFVDGDGLSGILAVNDVHAEELAFTNYLPTSIVYQIKPEARVLILEPLGGLEVWTALTLNKGSVKVVESNPLITSAVPELYSRNDVEVTIEDARSATRGCNKTYDIVSLPLTTPYHPIRSGAYSLLEDYGQTAQAYISYLNCLKPYGYLVATKWLQTPPSESLRVFTTIVTALENSGLSPYKRIVAFRGYNTMTFLVSNDPIPPDALATIRTFTRDRAFDIVFAPDIKPDEVNTHNILPEPVYYKHFQDYIQSSNRDLWYKNYPFDVRPSTDSHPFSSHFFKLSQTRQIFAELGKTWQPFGGAGYFVIIILLALSMCAASVLILVPALAARFPANSTRSAKCKGLITYGLIGLAFMFVEIPLTQRFILYLGHPAYAMTAVLFTILTASGVGSLAAQKFELRQSLFWIVWLGIAAALGFEIAFSTTLRFALSIRLVITVILLFPLGLLMGMPFSQGMHTFQLSTSRCIAYAWSVNGAASVVASVLAAFLALTTDFRTVYFLGLSCYAAAALIAPKALRVKIPPPRHP